MARLRFILLPFAILAALVFAPGADACTCAGTIQGSHPCLFYSDADAVFIGEVTEIGQPIPLKDKQDGQTLYTGREVPVYFSVEESFRGVAGKSLVIYNWGTTCDYGFEVGKRYFVYAKQSPELKKLHAGACGGTQLLTDAGVDISYARARAAGDGGPNLFGAVVRQMRRGAGDYNRMVGVEGVRVIVEGDRKTFELFTDADGRFYLGGLKAGKYRVRPDIPSDLRLLTEVEQEVNISEGRCVSVAFEITGLASIAGKVLDSDGGAAQVAVRLIPLDSNSETIATDVLYEAATDRDGIYRFEMLAAGRYLIAVNPEGQPRSDDAPYPKMFYPAASTPAGAAVITIAEGQVLRLDDFRLPPRLKQTVIEGTVLWPDGRVATEALISLEYTERQFTDGNNDSEEGEGHFLFKCFEGFKYIVHAEAIVNRRAVHAEPVEVLTFGRNKPLVLTLDRAGRDRSYLKLRKQK